VIATANGTTFSTNELVSVGVSGGNVNLTDSGIAVGTAVSSHLADSLTITPSSTNTNNVTISATGTDPLINITYLSKGTTGSHIFQPGTDSTQMFQLKSAGAGGIFASFDSSGKQFRIGDGAAPAQTLDVAGVFQVNSNGVPVKQGGIALAGAGLPGIVYNTSSGTATNASITATNMIASTPSTNTENCGAALSNATCYRISFYALQASLGIGCSTNTTIQVQVIFQDPLASVSATILVGTFVIATNGTASTPIPPATTSPVVSAVGGYMFRAKAATAIQYQTTVTAGTCTTKPTYAVIPFLEQL
jgi:hypothetical protein